MKKKLIVLSSSVLSFTPLVVLAQNAQQGACSGTNLPNLGTVQSILCRIGNILDTLIPILVVLGVVYFIWGVVQYIISSDEESKAKGRTNMIYGIIGLVVIVAMWGLVGIIVKTFDVGVGGGGLPIPTVDF